MANNKVMDDTILLDRLRNGDSSSFTLLYDRYFPSAAYYISQNHGSREDAEDVFQDAVTVLIEKIEDSNFELSSSLKTYLFAIVRNIWLKRLRARKNYHEVYIEGYEAIDENDTLSSDHNSLKTKILLSWITKITNHCQVILTAIFYQNVPMDYLMKKMGWKNKHTAANQQYKCLQQIKKQKDLETTNRVW